MALSYSFAGKKVLITGGGRGIGRTLVQKFYDGGASVFTLDKNKESIKKLKEDLPGVEAEIVHLSDWDLTKKVVGSFGPIDHLVNNAGVMIAQKFMDISKEAATLQLGINLGAAICVTQAVAKGLIETGREGSVVNICSVAGRRGNSIGNSVYSATKAGLESLTKTMAFELRPHKIRVNCVLPGIVEAPMSNTSDAKTLKLVDDMFIKQMIKRRYIQPEEIADTVMFLLSPLSSMIVGEAVVVDGGYLCK